MLLQGSFGGLLAVGGLPLVDLPGLDVLAVDLLALAASSISGGTVTSDFDMSCHPPIGLNCEGCIPGASMFMADIMSS